MKKKFMSLLLSASLVLSMMTPVGLVYAEESPNTGMVINKTVSYNKDEDNFRITLDAYATGSKITTITQTAIPTDIVLVLDQSGSMTSKITGDNHLELYTGNNRQNSSLYTHRFDGGDGNLYYKINDTQAVQVLVSRNTVPNSYAKYSTKTNTNFYNRNDSYGLYVLIDGDYKKVTQTVTPHGSVNRRYYEYTYTVNNVVVATGRSDQNNDGVVWVNGATDDATMYYANSTTTKYTYYYMVDSSPVVIRTSDGNNTNQSDFYYQTTEMSRLAALTNAVNNFKNIVAEKAAGVDGQLSITADNVNHRIAIVGFASESGYGNNTELLSISGSNSGSVGLKYDSSWTSANANYKNVLQNMDTAAGQSMITNAVNALAAQGATQTDLGLEMALKTLQANPLANGETRNRVVIVFTDGSPTSFDGFEADVANKAVDYAQQIKDLGVTVYTIGVFNNASVTNEDKTDSADSKRENYFMNSVSSNYPHNTITTDRWGNITGYTRGKKNDKFTDDYSYYLPASSSETLNYIFEMISDEINNGGATSSLTSETILKDLIAPQFTLPPGAEVSDIEIKMVPYKPGNANNPTYTEADWDYVNAGNATGVTATIGSDKTAPDGSAANGSLSVTGYNFSEHWVGIYDNNGTKTAQGAKLQISFDVDVREGFLGGNSVYTNTEAKVYLNAEDAANDNEFMTFPQPEVNVAIQEVKVAPVDKNVYLLGDINKDEMIKGSTATAKIAAVGDVKLDLNNPYDSDTHKIYGLDTWQTEYVDIVVEYKDKNGTVIYREKNGQKFEDEDEHFAEKPSSDDYENDGNFSIGVTVTPKDTNGVDENGKTLPGVKAEEQGEETSAKVNVFKPVMIFKDSHVYLGGEVSGSYNHDKNFVDVAWVHKNASGTVDMTAGTGEGKTTVLGTAPTLTETYETKTGIISDDTDIDVDVTEVKIGGTVVTSHVTFDHQECVENPKLEPTCTDMAEHPATAENKSEFKLHVYTPEMTFADTTAYYGDTAPTLNDATFLDATKTTWKYKDGTVAGDQMSNTAPTLTTTYTAEDGKIVNNLIETRGDIKVDATVKVGDTDITSYVRFNHTDCTNPADHIDSHKDDATKNEAWIHVKTCDLTVRKTMDGSKYDSTDNFVITVTGPNNFSQKIVLNGGDSKKLTGLRVGEYTVTEDTAWSWRYKVTGNNAKKALSVAAPSASAEIKNEVETNKWISVSSIVENLFENGAVHKKSANQ